MTALLFALLAGAPKWRQVADEIVPGRTVYALNAFEYRGRMVLFEEEGVWSSADGKTWSLLCPKDEMPGSPTIGRVVATAGRIFALGAADEVWTSSDGKSWKRQGRTVPAAGVPASDGERAWLFAAQGRAWSTIDGKQWRREEGADWVQPLAAVSHARALYLLDADGGTWVRSHGTWTRTGSDGPWLGRWRPSFASFDGRLWMIGGTDKTDYWTFDREWMRFELPRGWRPRATPRLVGFNGSLFVFGGKTGHPQDSNPQSVWTVR